MGARLSSLSAGSILVRSPTATMMRWSGWTSVLATRSTCVGCDGEVGVGQVGVVVERAVVEEDGGHRAGGGVGGFELPGQRLDAGDLWPPLARLRWAVRTGCA